MKIPKPPEPPKPGHLNGEYGLGDKIFEVVVFGFLFLVMGALLWIFYKIAFLWPMCPQ